MSTFNLTDIFNARRKAQDELRSFYDENGVANLSAEAQVKEEKISSEIRRLQNLEEVAIREQAASEAYRRSPLAGLHDSRALVADQEYRQFQALIRSGQGAMELRDAVTLTAGTATDGAELVQTTVLGDVIRKLAAESDVAAIGPNTITTAGGNPLQIPLQTSSSDTVIEGETDTIADSSPQFSTVTLGAFKYAHIVPISNELLADAEFDIMTFVVEQSIRSLNAKIAADYVTGAGTTAPLGIDNAATTGLTTAAVNAVTFDELIEATHSVIPAHRRNAKWVFSSATIEAVRKLKDGNGDYLWRPGGQAGVPDTLLGYPVVESPDIADMATGVTFGCFGNFAAGSIARYAGPLRVEVSTQANFTTDKTLVRFIQRFDSNLGEGGAIVKLVNA